MNEQASCRKIRGYRCLDRREIREVPWKQVTPDVVTDWIPGCGPVACGDRGYASQVEAGGDWIIRVNRCMSIAGCQRQRGNGRKRSHYGTSCE
ncbi:MAG: hypothetical protein AAFX56_00730 [Pseudomonadota bacterium]